ncbi:MAG: hypothetical protein ABGW81_09245 [Paracoccaceae bacterium]
MKLMQLHFYHGPNLIVRHAAVVGEFNVPTGEKKLAVDKARNFFGLRFPDQIVKRISFPKEDLSFERLVALLTKALLDYPGVPTGLEVELKPVDTGASCIIVGIVNPKVAVAVLDTAEKIARTMLFDDGIDYSPAIKTMMANVAQLLSWYQPDPRDRLMMHAARERNIPVYVASPGSLTWRYGQGVAARDFVHAASCKDSFSGYLLVKNKFFSNHLVTRLGFPGVQHEIATNPEEAKTIAKELGYPVVVKPVDLQLNIGVTPGI